MQEFSPEKFCFEKLFGIEKDKFLCEFYETKPFYVREQITRSRDIIDWAGIEKLLSNHRLSAPRMRLFNDGLPVSESAYSRSIGGQGATSFSDIEPGLFRKYITKGATLVIDAVNELHPEIDAIAATLERHFGAQIQANLYAVLGSTAGFDIHWDDHDTVVVQVSGEKKWEIYAPTRSHPIKDDIEQPPLPTSKPQTTIVMKAGDVLYLPRGWWHRVISQGESIHATYGFGKPQQIDVLQLLKRRLHNFNDFRKDLPSHVTHNKVSSERNLEQLKAKMVEVIHDISIDDIWHFVDTMRRVRGQVELSAINGPEPKYVIRNWRVKPFVSARDGVYQLSFRGKSLKSRVDFSRVVERLDSGDPVNVSDLCSDIIDTNNGIDSEKANLLIKSLREICMVREYVS